jgi:hypothetical protein
MVSWSYKISCKLSHGGYRIEVTYTTTNIGGTRATRLYVAYNNNTAGLSIFAWGFQTEDKTKATSYIATTSASATRAADINTVLSSYNLPFLENDWALSLEVFLYEDGLQDLFGNNTATTDRFKISISDTGSVQFDVGTIDTPNITVLGNTVLTSNQWYRITIIKANDLIYLLLDGVLEASNSISISGMTAFTHLYLSGGGSLVNEKARVLRNLRVWNFPLSNFEGGLI